MPKRIWRRTLDRQNNPISDAWSLLDPNGEVLAQIWLEKNPSNENYNRWQTLRFYNIQGVKMRIEASFVTGKTAKIEMETLTPYALRKQ